MAAKSAMMSVSFKGAMKGETTLVAISDVPLGSLSIKGLATNVNSWSW